jgi:hypothetical protein
VVEVLAVVGAAGVANFSAAVLELAVQGPGRLSPLTHSHASQVFLEKIVADSSSSCACSVTPGPAPRPFCCPSSHTLSLF